MNSREKNDGFGRRNLMFLTRLRAQRRRGVTLIEVVISLFVLTIGIVGILSLFPTGYRLTRRAVERSISALAARHALARVYGRINSIRAPKAADEPLAKVEDARRVGTIRTVASTTLQCYVTGNQSPLWPSLAGYFIVMTSGVADGHIYPIASNSADTISVGSSVRFNTLATDRQYEPVRVGDCFAIIGIKGGSGVTDGDKCFPDPFLGGSLSSITDPVKGADPEKNETRTMPVAAYGAATQAKDLWRYSYGCILTCPPPERPDTCRLDVFAYSGFPYRAASGATTYPDPSTANSQVIGHYVTYIAAGKKN